MEDAKNNEGCPFCEDGELSTRPAIQYPHIKEKVDVYCSKCGYVFTGTILEEAESE